MRDYPESVALDALARLRPALRVSPAALPGAVAFLIFIFWAVRDGGFDPVRWLPGTLFLLALLLVTVLAVRPDRPSRPILIALAALAAFTVWSYLSMWWAGAPGVAWTGANRTLLYLCVFTLFAAYRWQTRAAAALLGAYAVGIAGVGLFVIARLAGETDPALSFIGGRLIVPISYSNANCALFLIGFFPALYLASRREVHPILRGTLLASAAVCGELALMVQSRASMGAFPIALGVYFLLTSARLRSLLVLAAVGLAVLLAAPRVLDIYTVALTAGEVDIAASEALWAIVGSAASLLVVGTLLGVVDRRTALPPDVVRVIGRVAAVSVCLGLAIVVSVILVRTGNPVDQAQRWLEEFRVDRQDVVDPNVPHLSSGFGGGRYDLWRVAWRLFVDHPVRGIGVDNFHVELVQLRRFLNDSAYPHSLPLRVLSQTGLVGATLFLLFLIASFVAVAGTVRRTPRLTRGLAGAACVGFVYWFVHGAVDWFWEMPALAAPAFAMLGISMRLGQGPAPLPRTPAVRVVEVVGGFALLVAAISLTLPWLAARETDQAIRSWRVDPQRAVERLDKARRLDPLSDEADVFASVIAAELGDEAGERAALGRALERNPRNWYPYMELGVLEMRAGRREAARRYVARALRLNPLENALLVVERWLREGHTPTRQEVDEVLIARAAHLQGGAR